jgi:hypothetical protein
MTVSQLNKLQLWRERFRQFEKSSLSVAQFCHSVGCSVGSFYKWRHKLVQPLPSTMASVHATPQTSVASFLQVSTQDNLAVSIQLRSGVVLTIPLEAIDVLPSILERVS